MKQTLAVIGIVLALTSYITVIVTSLNVLAVIGCVFVSLLALGLTSKIVTAIIERKQKEEVI